MVPVLLVLLASGVRLSREEQQTYLLTYSPSLEMRGIPVLVQYRALKVTVLYTAVLLNTAVYRPAVLVFNKFSS